MTAVDRSLGSPALITSTTLARIVIGQDLAGMLEALVARLAPDLFTLVGFNPYRHK